MTVYTIGATTIAIGWLLAMGGAIAWIVRWLGRKRLRTRAYPLRLLPWYLGGEPEVTIDTPPDSARAARRRARRR